MLDVNRLFCPLSEQERQCLAAIRFVHRSELAARRLGFHLQEYRRLLFWRHIYRDRLFGPPEHWL